MKRAKRVRFIESVPDGSQSGRSEAASASCKSTGTPESNEPKTSEFAFFKKFREGSGLKHQPKSPSRRNVQLNCSKGKKYGGVQSSTEQGHSTGAKDNNTICKSSFFTENRPSETEYLLSPHDDGSRRFEHGNKNFTSSPFIKNNGKNDREQDLGLSPFIRTPKSSGNDDLFLDRATETVKSDTYYMDGDLFSKKRANLQSLVAKTIFTGTGETVRGCDLMSLLLNRLQPENFGTNDSEALKSRHDEEDTEYEPNLKKTWTERTLIKHEDPYFMDVGASSLWSNEFHTSFPLERPFRSGFPAFEYVDQMVPGHQDRELEPCYFPNIRHKQYWSENSAETFLKANAEHLGNFRTFNCRETDLGDESFQEHPWNAYSAQGSFFGNADSSIPYMNKNGNRFLLEYERREPECIPEAWSGSCNSPGRYRSSALESVIEADESSDELGYTSFSRKPSNLFLGWDSDEVKENETRHSFPSNALMHYHQTPEISEVDDVFLEFDSRSKPPLQFSSEFIPETEHPSPYLLLEGDKDEYEQTPRLRQICYHSTTSMSRSPSVELIEPSQVLKLDWRDTDEEDTYIL